MQSKIILFGLLTLLGGCASNSGNGGSGGGDFTSGTPTPGIITPGSTFSQRKKMFESTSEYASTIVSGGSNQLRLINAADAYANGWTGNGQVIAVADSGFHTDHQELTGKTAGLVTSAGYTPTVRDTYHGTGTASVAAGSRGNGEGMTFNPMHGVAFDARLHYTQIPLGDGSDPYRPYSLDSDYNDVAEAQHYSWLINPSRVAGARINNFSFGIADAVGSYKREDIREKMPLYASIIAQSHMYDDQDNYILINRPDADKNIIIWAAGNQNNGVCINNCGDGDPSKTLMNIDASTPALFAGVPLVFTELQKNVLVVVSLNNGGDIADYSNRCGAAKAFCIAAPGFAIAAGYNFLAPTGYNTVGGTSFAAPLVSGSFAVLRQRFPMLGSHELVARIKTTANNTGIYADSDIYGVGLLDLGAAVNDPVGEMTMSGISLNANSFTPGFSFGDALKTAFSGQLVTGFDELLTPFEYNLGGFVKTQTPSSLNPLRAFHQDWHRQQNAENGANTGFGAAGFALNSNPEGSSYRIFANPNSHMTLAQGGLNFALKPREKLAFSLFNTAKKDGTPTAAGLSFAWQKTANFGVGGGVLRENEMALQSKGEGVFGGLNANTFFFGIAGKKQWRNWQFHAGAEAGAVFVDGDYWLDDVSTLLTSSLSADATRKLGDRNTLRLGISSPLRVEHGDANLTIPAGRTRYRELLHRKITPSLVPSGRQIDLTATWSRKLPFPNAWVYASLRNSYQPGHRKNADSEMSALLSLELGF